ncbi:hypothetical protein LSTR_LSTR012230 [Laodelphax striatellus]|uniref:THAP-type domain-containing protein n=1 Tax=Laodelphax striatellus TaxID=195883 RepID=A0A482WRR6_LAOST|nr:hypothetical protein LSTR_LSTR012230 [Laodelphax striatellus]
MDFQGESFQTEREQNEEKCTEFVQVFIKEEVFDDDDYSKDVDPTSIEDVDESTASQHSALNEEETNRICPKVKFTSENVQCSNAGQSAPDVAFAQNFIEETRNGKIMMSSSADSKRHSRNVCSFKGCGRSKAHFPKLRFYSFPVNRPRICELWIENCANYGLKVIEKKTLNKRVVCQKHFEDDCFLNALKIRLKTYAVPTILSDDILSEAEEEQTPSNIGMETDDLNQLSKISRLAEVFVEKCAQETITPIAIVADSKSPASATEGLSRNHYKQQLRRIARKPTKVNKNIIKAAIQKLFPEKAANFFCMQLSHADKKNRE